VRGIAQKSRRGLRQAALEVSLNGIRHVPERRSPQHKKTADLPILPDNGYFVIFGLLATLHDYASTRLRHDDVDTTPLREKILGSTLWHIVQIAWTAHLTSRELYLGDLMRPGVSPETLRESVAILIRLGWLEEDHSHNPKLAQHDTGQTQLWVIRLTPDGARRSQALATELLRTIHEHCSLAGINPFARRAPAWGGLSNRLQSRSNRRSRHHPRQS
jgi:hypothetical protein